MIKTISFGIMHISVAFLVIWVMTGDWRVGGVTALVEPLINTCAYHVHERIWNRNRDPKGPALSASVPGW